LAAQETRALLTAGKLLQTKRQDVEMSVRGVLRGFGLRVGPTTPRIFETRVHELVDGHPTLVRLTSRDGSRRSAITASERRCTKRQAAPAR
jgi:transposase